MGMKALEQYSLPQLPPLDQVSSQKPTQVQDLDGRQLDLTLDSGSRFCLNIGDGTGAFETSVPGWPAKGTCTADVCVLRDNVYVVSLDLQEPVTDALTVVLMMAQGRAVLVYHKYIGDDTAQFDRGPNVSQSFFTAVINGADISGETPSETKELLGGRDFLVFDEKNIREFIYVNKSRLLEHYVYTQMLNGKVERHHASYIKLDDQLYLIGWREMDTNMAYAGVFDYRNNRMQGSCFSLVSPWEATAKLTGALIIPVNGRIDYLDGLEPTH